RAKSPLWVERSPSNRLTQNDDASALVGSLVARSAATERVAKIVLFRTSRAMPAMRMPAIDLRWIERRVSLQSVSVNTRAVVAMRTQVHGCVRKSATDRMNIAAYFVTEGDFEKSRRTVRKRYAKTRAAMVA